MFNVFPLHFTKSSQSSCISELSYRFHKIIVGLACENFIDDSPSAKRAFEAALSALAELEAKSSQTDSINRNIDHNLMENGDVSDPFTFKLAQYEP